MAVDPTLADYQRAVDEAQAALDSCNALTQILTDLWFLNHGGGHGAGWSRDPIPGLPNCGPQQKALADAQKALADAQRFIGDSSADGRNTWDKFNDDWHRNEQSLHDWAVNSIEEAMAPLNEEQIQNFRQRYQHDHPSTADLFDEALDKLKKDKRGIYRTTD